MDKIKKNSANKTSVDIFNLILQFKSNNHFKINKEHNYITYTYMYIYLKYHFAITDRIASFHLHGFCC